MGGYQQYQYELFDLDPQRPLKIICQPLYDHAAEHGFPPDFFKESYFDHVVFGEVPENMDCSFSQFHNCTFAASQIIGGVFDNASLYDCAFRGAELRMVNFTGATITNTHFRDSGLTSVSFQEASLKSCSMRDCSVDRVDFVGAVLDGTLFERIQARRVLNLHSASITQGGATPREVRWLVVSTFRELGAPYFHAKQRPAAAQRRKAPVPGR